MPKIGVSDVIFALRHVAHPAAPPSRQTFVAARESTTREFGPAPSFAVLQTVVSILCAGLYTRYAFHRGWRVLKRSADLSDSIQCASFRSARAWRAHALQRRHWRRAIDTILSAPRRSRYPARKPRVAPARFLSLCGLPKSSIASLGVSDQRALRSTTMLKTSSRERAFVVRIVCSTPGSRVSVSASSSRPYPNAGALGLIDHTVSIAASTATKTITGMARRATKSSDTQPPAS